ncbi:MAG: hypothetical protein WKI04_02530 [Ferruginibacter sp.]
MTKLFLLVAISLVVNVTHAQDIKDIRNYALIPGQLQKGKEAVDKFLAEPKNAQKLKDGITRGIFITNCQRILLKLLRRIKN